MKLTPFLCFRLLQLSAASVLFARGWQHLYWDAPYRALLWDQAWMEGVVRWGLGLEWQAYVTHPHTDIWIQYLVVAIGVFYVISGFAALFVRHLGRPARVVLWLSSLSLMLLAGLYCKDKFFFLGQFFEYTLQFTAPAVLAWSAARPGRWSGKPLALFLKVAIALTFTCHGLYAVGFYPRPGYFLFMTMSILGVGEAAAVGFLNTAATLDFLLSVLIFLPGRVARYALLYAVFWGLSTTLARPWAYAYVASWETVLLQWVHEAVMRFPHFMGPLIAWQLTKRPQPAPLPLTSPEAAVP